MRIPFAFIATFLKRCNHFLGSIAFTIALLIVTLLFCVAGTILESINDSHKKAALFTYDHPLFSLLFWLFFVNILCAALKRYPFKKKHLPFLLAHLGLLMIFSGTFIKNHFGFQGYMELKEGASSSYAFISNSKFLHVETHYCHFQIPVKNGYLLGLKMTVLQEEPLQLMLEERGKSEKVSLELNGKGKLVLDEKYVLSLQNKWVKLPHKVRLREAKKTYYPGTEQVKSYVSRLLIDDKPVQISMNNVHETEKGYRFYMSQLYEPKNLGAKKVALIINRDPAKYILTYPGAMFLALGAFLLFFFKR